MKIGLLILSGLLLTLPAWADAPPIKLGVALPLTGDAASIGEDAKAGITLAVEDINAKGGVLGRRLVADFADDACDPKSAVTVANKFVSMNADAAMELCSPACMAQGPVYAEENTPYVVICSTEQATAQGWPNIIRSFPDNKAEAQRLDSLIKALAAHKTLAVIYDPHEFDANMYKNISAYLDAQNIKPDVTIDIPNGTVDFGSVITQLKEKKIETVYLGVFIKSMGLFLRQAHDAGYRPQFITTQAGSVKDVLDIAGPAALEGTVYTDLPDPAAVPAAAPVMKTLAARGYANRPYAVYSYAQVETYAAAAQAAGTTDKAAVIKALHSQSFKTILGAYGFDASGNLRGFDFRAMQWHNGKPQPWIFESKK